MQNTKDTFYITLRDRLATINPARTTVVRGQSRPAMVVDENELPSQQSDEGVFHLTWGDRITDNTDALPLDALTCEIRYSAHGGDALSVQARGREIAAMDSELDAMLQPSLTQKMSYTADGASSMGTNIFWCEEGQRTLDIKADTLTRTAHIVVMSYREAGEA